MTSTLLFPKKNSSSVGSYWIYDTTNANSLTPSSNSVLVDIYQLNCQDTITTVNITTQTITTSSDYRLKEDIKPLDLNIYNIDNLNPVTFKYKISEKDSIGFIAHEIQEHFPFLVDGEKDGSTNQSVNYIGLIGLLVKEIQELKREKSIIQLKPEFPDDLQECKEGSISYNKLTKKLQYYNGKCWIEL